MKKFNFTVKDIIFIAVISAALTLSGMLTMPLVMSVDLFGLRNMASSLFSALFAMLGIMKVKKIGTLSLIGLFHGFVLLMMAPVMFWSISLAGLMTEIIIGLVFKNYETEKSRVAAATLFIPLSIPGTLIFSMLINGKTVEEVINNGFWSIAFIVGSVVLSYVGAKLGQKIGKELQKAGKL